MRHRPYRDRIWTRRWMGGTTLVVLLTGASSALGQPGGVALPVVEALEEGRLLFDNLEPGAAIERFGEVIDTLSPVVDAGTATAEQLTVLRDGLAYRIRAAFSIGRSDTVQNDLERLIAIDPGFDCSTLVSPVLIERCSGRRSQLVGTLDLQVVFADAEIEVGGEAVDPADGPIPVLAGAYEVVVNRPGYQGVTDTVEVSAGPDRPTVHEIELTRVSAVLRVMTRPPGATVHVETIPFGPTQGTSADDASQPTVIEGHPRREFSEELVVPNVAPGPVSVAITREGYRTVRADLDLDAPVDYPLRFVLERAEGTVVFEGLPAGAMVELQRRGEPDPIVTSVESGELVLPIGVYDVSVSHPAAGLFEGTATVIDREVYRLPVRLRPTLALIGALGGDPAGRSALIGSLVRVLGRMDAWHVQDRTDAAAPAIEEAGLTAEILRAQVSMLAPRRARVDWPAVQQAVDRELGASLYLLGVLDDDPARDVDLWLWRSAPGSARPSRLRVPRPAAGRETMADVLIPAFDRATVSRPWLGAQLIDTGVEAGPFVVDVTSGGPAEVAGLRAGDVLVGIEGTEVRRAAEVETVLTDVPLEGSISLAFTRDGVARQAQLTRRDSPAVVPVGDPSVAHAAVSARLHATLDRERSGQPTWVWELNDATTRLAVGDLEGAIEILRRVERAAPDRPGVGRATVYYWLGVAYAAAGPEFSDQARRNLEWASEIADGRLGHDDGPWVTPRARARLARLAGR